MTYPDQADVDKADAALNAVADQWMAWRGVISLEVARRWKDGAATNDVGIRVTLAKLLPVEEVPEGELFPREVDGVPVDLVEGSPYQPES